MPDQTEKIMDCIIYPLFYKDGTRKGLLTIGRDVTEHEKTRENLENARRHQNVINRLQNIALSADSLEKQLGMALEEIYSLPWLPLQPKGAVFLKSEKEEEMLELVAQRNLEPGIARLCSKVPSGWCLCGKAAEQKEILFSRGVDERHDGDFSGMNDHGHYIIPIMRDNDLLGVVCLYLDRDHRETEAEYEFLSVLREDQAFREKRLVSVEYRLERPDGTERILLEQLERITSEPNGIIRISGGEVYPEWLSITTVKDDNGETVNYVAVFHDMSELKEKEAQVHHHLYNDPLTGLPNKTLFMDRLSVAIDKTRESRTPIAVMILDLDNFKHVNDTYGHSFGDILLQMAAKRLASGIRNEDTMAREGGDEFLFLLNRLTSQETSADVAMRLIRLMVKPFYLKGEEVYLTCSICITLFPADGREPEELVKNADIAMHRTKETGKNSYQLFTSTMNDRVQRRMLLENSLRKALSREEFVVYYQPKVSLSTGKITSMEALVRWRQEDGTLVSPVEFIPVAEETGIIVEIGERVLKDACRVTKQLNDQGYDIKVSVNLSPKQFRHTGLLDQIMQTLSASGLPPLKTWNSK